MLKSTSAEYQLMIEALMTESLTDTVSVIEEDVPVKIKRKKV
jgi:hypothetical protein